MITLTWGDLRSQDFQEAIDRLIKKPMGFELGQKFVLIGRELKKQKAMMIECHEKLLKEFGTPDPKVKGSYVIPDGSTDKFAAEMKKMIEHRFEIKLSKFDPVKISEKIDLCPQDWLALDMMMAEIKEPLKAVSGATDINQQNGKAKPQDNLTHA